MGKACQYFDELMKKRIGAIYPTGHSSQGRVKFLYISNQNLHGIVKNTYRYNINFLFSQVTLQNIITQSMQES